MTVSNPLPPLSEERAYPGFRWLVLLLAALVGAVVIARRD